MSLLHNQLIIKMKQLLLLFLGLTMLSCSSDDSPSTTNPPANNTVQVLTHTYELYETTATGKRFDFTAIVKNNKSTAVEGVVKFDIADNGGNAFIYSDNVTIEPGETKTITKRGTAYFQTQTLNITSVTFVEAE